MSVGPDPEFVRVDRVPEPDRVEAIDDTFLEALCGFLGERGQKDALRWNLVDEQEFQRPRDEDLGPPTPRPSSDM
nr:hypothetical protein [Haloglomus irregulare]